MRIDKFIMNLTREDVDLINKLDYLNGNEQISEEDYILARKEENFKNIEEFIIEILQNEDDLSNEYISFIEDETKDLYEDGLCEKDDFTAGLYNCDVLYLFAIEDVLHGDDHLI